MGWPGVLVTIDEQESRRAKEITHRRETAEQKRAFAADHDREASVDQRARRERARERRHERIMQGARDKDVVIIRG